MRSLTKKIQYLLKIFTPQPSQSMAPPQEQPVGCGDGGGYRRGPFPLESSSVMRIPRWSEPSCSSERVRLLHATLTVEEGSDGEVEAEYR